MRLRRRHAAVAQRTGIIRSGTGYIMARGKDGRYPHPYRVNLILLRRGMDSRRSD